MSDEWYTPARYIQAAHQVMGGVDLDPASSLIANQTVRAKQIYTKEQNGLEHGWYGRIWLNPPFARIQTPGKKTNQGLWILKLVEEYEAGRVTEGILLTTCRPDASWFSPLWNYLICFCDHKVGFYSPQAGRILQELSHMHGTIFVYLGTSGQRFIDGFSQFGPVTHRVSPVREMQKQISLWNEVTA